MEFKKFKAATVQTSSVFLNVEATVAKAITFVKEASENGATLIAFPEVFIAGYPYWNWIMTPIQGSKWYEKLYKCSVKVEDEIMQPLFQAAIDYNCHIVIGINERGDSYGEIYNTNLIINNKGILVGKHRKLVPTWAEKLTWTSGDGSSLKVYDTEVGPIGTLACGENTNTLARFTLLAQGELVHIANYISLPVAPPDYNMAEAIKIRAAAHSFEGKLFTIVSCSTISQEIMDALKEDVPNVEKLLTRKNSAFSGFIGPNGAVIGEPLIDE
jgi:nitrilase